MKFKDKKSMTGAELCDLEGIIFPVMASAHGKEDAQKDAILNMVNKRGKDIVKLCYTDDEGKPINKVEFQFRIQLMQDMPMILTLIFGDNLLSEKKAETSEKKSEVIPITR